MDNSLGTYVTYNPTAVSAEARISDLLQMVESLAMHHFPVVDDEQRLVGVVSETDLIRASENRDEQAAGGNGTIQNLFQKQAVTVDHQASPRRALQLLIDYRINSLPVLQSGKLIGIVTTSDFLREFSYGEMTCSKEPVSEFLEKPSGPLEPDSTIADALAGMDKNKTDHQAVIQGGCPVGIVSRRDIVKAMSLGGIAGILESSASILAVLRKTPGFRPGQRLSEAAAIMVEQRLSGLAVTNQANRYLGLITIDAILQVMLRNLPR